MADDSIERLVIKIEGDYSKLLTDVAKSVAEAESRLKKLEETSKKAFEDPGKSAKKAADEAIKATKAQIAEHRKVLALTKQLDKELGTIPNRFEAIGRSARALGGIFNYLKALVVGFIAAFTVSKIVDFFKSIGSAAIATNAQFETFTTQFTTLLGSVGAARQRINELTEFAVSTPFQLPEVVEASRVLEVFGGRVLATGENLRMIGDIAAGVNQPFQDVAFWVGRMYDAIQSGRPFGEAAMRLQEMGALSGDTRAKLEQLQKSGADASEIFGVFADEVGGRFAGNMERLAQTFQGIISNLNDFRDQLLRIGGEEFFEGIRQDAKRLLDILSDSEFSEATRNLAKSIGQIFVLAEKLASSAFFAELESIDPKSLDRLADSIEDATAALAELLNIPWEGELGGLVDVLTVIIDHFTFMTNQLNTFIDRAQALGAIIDAIKPGTTSGIMTGITAAIPGGGANLNDFMDAFQQGTGVDPVEVSRKVADASATEEQKQRKLIDAYKELAQARQDSADAANALIEVPEPEPIDTTALEMAQDFSLELADIVEERNEAIEKLEAEHNEKSLEMEQEYLKKRAELEGDWFAELAELALETAEKRDEIFADAADDLAKLERDIDKKIAEERGEFEEEELRETEDHLREMRRLRSQYSEDLEGAVKNRDARAIVDLQRRYQLERNEQRTDFEVKQAREREDKDKRLAQLRQEEQERADEIIRNRDREIQQLMDSEARKRDEINNSFKQQMADLNAASIEKVNQENAEYEERKAILEAALAERLEAIAKELAEEDKINEEGAEKILETLAEHFGEGGSIDELMEAYRNRLQTKMQIKIEFEGGELPSASGAGDTSGGGNTSMPLRTFARGGRVLATRPMAAIFGEAGPEIGEFTPLGQMEQNHAAGQGPQVHEIRFSGSAPPGVGISERDSIAGVIVGALIEAGVRVRPGSR